MISFIDRAAPALQGLRAYDPGHDLPKLRAQFPAQQLVELGSNENAWGPSPRVLEALSEISVAELFRYPDPLVAQLRNQLAAMHQVSAEEIVVGNGSHEILMQLAQIFCVPGDELIYSQFGFAVYPIAARAVGATPIAAKAHDAAADMPLGHDLAAMLAAITARCRLICLANPNNPTGTWLTIDELRAFLQAVPAEVPVVIDEAYIEYANAPGLQSAMSLRAEFPNLMITRTFSKAYGLAGLRIGYVVAHQEITSLINRLRESFCVNALALRAASLALDDAAHLGKVVAATVSERERVRTALQAQGLNVLPSQSNFLLIDFAHDATRIEAALLASGVVVRPMQAYGLPNCLRVTIATPVENDRFIQALAL